MRTSAASRANLKVAGRVWLDGLVIVRESLEDMISHEQDIVVESDGCWDK